MKKCRIVKTENGFAVRSTNFLNHCDADMYAYYLANTLNNGGKLIYVANADEAIERHNQLEGATNGDWLRLCWNRNAGCYLHTKNVYALKDNSLHGNGLPLPCVLEQTTTVGQKQYSQVLAT